MTEIETLYTNKRTLNSGYIFFDDSRKASTWEDILKKYKVSYTCYVLKNSDHKYIGFKMFRIRNQFLKICIELKGVIG